jgi:hypothetical protein
MNPNPSFLVHNGNLATSPGVSCFLVGGIRSGYQFQCISDDAYASSGGVIPVIQDLFVHQ